MGILAYFGYIKKSPTCGYMWEILGD